MAQRVVVIGGSAGAMEPLQTIAAGLPVDFPAPVLVVIHLAPTSPSLLPRILDRAGPLSARVARDGDALKPGELLVASPDRHLVVDDGVVRLSRGPRENRQRPAIDALFTSAARWWGPAVIAVVLSGALDDGAAGAVAVAAQDGLVLVQDPREARVSVMPRAALRVGPRARSVPVDRLAVRLTELVRAPAAQQREPADEMVQLESSSVDSGPVKPRGGLPGVAAALGCPECHGGMFEVSPSGGMHYVCHVGHSWSPQTLLAAQREVSEAALYNAASKLREEATVLRRLADLAVTRNQAADMTTPPSFSAKPSRQTNAPFTSRAWPGFRS